jgi:hypothetical protein
MSAPVHEKYKSGVENGECGEQIQACAFRVKVSVCPYLEIGCYETAKISQRNDCDASCCGAIG